MSKRETPEPDGEIPSTPAAEAAPSPSNEALRGLAALMFDPLAQDALNAARSEADVDPELRRSLVEYRLSSSYRRVYEQEEPPLVSVCICTYNRARLLTERCLPSILAEDYPNFEIVVAGDGCTDETEEAVRNLGDSRVTFVNLPRGDYPAHPLLRWLVAGTIPVNHARALAKGDLTTHVDDDDEFVPGRLAKLVGWLRETRAEVVWHPFWTEAGPGEWIQWPAPEFRAGQVTAGSVMYLSWFNRIECDPRAYRYLEPADWNLYRKFSYIGAKLSRHPEPLLRHHRERTQM